MYTFYEIWTLLEPKTEYANLINKCKELWESFSPEKQQEVFLKIEKKKLEKKFVDYNPLLAIRNNSSFPSGRDGVGFHQTLSFADYYRRYNTTEETDGWHRQFLPEKQTTIYIKN